MAAKSAKIKADSGIIRPRPAAITLRDVARAAGVSVQTVSCVVNNTGSVSDKVRARVRELVVELGYRPNRSARTMRTGRSYVLALVVSDIRNPFFPQLVHAIDHAAAQQGYTMLLVNCFGSAELAAERIESLKSHAVDGVIATEDWPAIRQLGVPTVILGDAAAGTDVMKSNDTRGGQMLAKHLLELGHTRIGLVSSPLGGCIAERRAAFIDEIADRAQIAWEVVVPDDQVASDLLASVDLADATAIVCSNDLIAIGVMRVLSQRGLQVPGDFSVTGFDDVPWAEIVTPMLTTIRQPFSGLGDGAIKMLTARLLNPRRRRGNVVLDVELMVRGTTAHPKYASKPTILRIGAAAG